LLPKGTMALVQAAAAYGEPMVPLKATLLVNEAQPAGPVVWLRRVLGDLNGRRVCIAGLTFKQGTDDLRQSPCLKLARLLSLEGVSVSGWDPQAQGAIEYVEVADSLEGALRDADALVVAHAWDGWQDVDPMVVNPLMRQSVVWDASAVLDTGRWIAAGFVTNRRSSPRRQAMAGR
jgi:UDPglucose 6-dehydrogenase